MQPDMDAKIGKTRKRLLFLIVIPVAFFLVWFYQRYPEITQPLNGDDIATWIDGAGYLGPLLIITLMAFAIVATPIPSAPIALASGAVYGHFFGTIYVVIGAEFGALIAFIVARFLGRDFLKRWLGDIAEAGWLGSQNALTAAVFTSRLLPFVSFDLVSYAAGLSNLRLWRFALATLAGIVPASFLLAHFGDEAAKGETMRATWAAFAIGLFVVIPIGFTYFRRRQKQFRSDQT